MYVIELMAGSGLGPTDTTCIQETVQKWGEEVDWQSGGSEGRDKDQTISLLPALKEANIHE